MTGRPSLGSFVKKRKKMSNTCHVVGERNVTEPFLSKHLLPKITKKYVNLNEDNVIEIKTKYYTSAVKFSQQTPNQFLETEISDDVQGMLLVYPLTYSIFQDLTNSLPKLCEDWLKQCQIYSDLLATKENFETRMMIAYLDPAQIPNQKDNNISYIDFFEEKIWYSNLASTIREWCLDNNFEIVFVGPSSDEQSQQNSKSIPLAERDSLDKVHQDDDDHVIDNELKGEARIIEAIECTLWTHTSKPDESNLAAKEEVSKENETQTQKKPLSENKEEAAKKKKEEIENALFGGLLRDKESPVGEKTSSEEAEIEEYDKLLVEMMKLKRDGHQMPHDQRKEKATAFALQLASMLGLGMDDADDEEEEDNSEEA